MYITQAIILSRDVIRDKQIRTIVFTREYGRITTWERKISNGDIGSLVELKIERRGSENTIEHISVVRTPDTTGWDFATVVEYLSMLNTLKELLPYGYEQGALFDDVSHVVGYISRSNLSDGNAQISQFQLFILVQIRILKMLGVLVENYYRGPLLSTIYDRLDKVSMKSMFLSKPLGEETEITLRKSILASIHPYISPRACSYSL